MHADHVVLDTATTQQFDRTYKVAPLSKQLSCSNRLPYDCLAVCTGGTHPSGLHQAGIATAIADRKAGILVSHSSVG